ncbi:uncharacterized protein MONBRDRAFT_31433 [Monosiga brevicollis MX1]|uniref:Helicase C-terminal domain-containing protein n=1 Tax=Monosiga brevicollis TaxID=81824 RepID=A9UT46_MONBE|nr:uncharacterized protein MONBRDRAFT_31433 [Monosiga brevicollis MX1]EDQ91181.1 predicted protein [Monosiga brevicollis MX1]|eukprot:XP_001743603.1 hypothetical protein [Monosiga brevicollis MX1]
MHAGLADLLVTTASALDQGHWRPLTDAGLDMVVIDEFDAIFDGAHDQGAWRLLQRAIPHAFRNGRRKDASSSGSSPLPVCLVCLPFYCPATRVLFTGATLPDRGDRSVMSLLQYRLPGLHIIRTPQLHKPRQRLRQTLIRLQDAALSDSARAAEVQRVLQQKCAGKRTIVFCNTVKQVTQLCANLQDTNVIEYHGKLPKAIREQRLAAFCADPTATIVSTDLLSRGLDLPVDAVIQAYFATVSNLLIPCSRVTSAIKEAILPPPSHRQNVSIYLHRIGRTARHFAPGEAISLLAADEGHLARAVEEALAAEAATTQASSRGKGKGKDTLSPAELEERRASLQDLFSRKRGLRRRVQRYGNAAHRD